MSVYIILLINFTLLDIDIIILSTCNSSIFHMSGNSLMISNSLHYLCLHYLCLNYLSLLIISIYYTLNILFITI